MEFFLRSRPRKVYFSGSKPFYFHLFFSKLEGAKNCGLLYFLVAKKSTIQQIPYLGCNLDQKRNNIGKCRSRIFTMAAMIIGGAFYGDLALTSHEKRETMMRAAMKASIEKISHLI